MRNKTRSGRLYRQDERKVSEYNGQERGRGKMERKRR